MEEEEEDRSHRRGASSSSSSSSVRCLNTCTGKSHVYICWVMKTVWVSASSFWSGLLFITLVILTLCVCVLMKWDTYSKNAHTYTQTHTNWCEELMEVFCCLFHLEHLFMNRFSHPKQRTEAQIYFGDILK